MYSGRRNPVPALLEVFPEIWGDFAWSYADASASDSPVTQRAATPGSKWPRLSISEILYWGICTHSRMYM